MSITFLFKHTRICVLHLTDYQKLNNLNSLCFATQSLQFRFQDIVRMTSWSLKEILTLQTRIVICSDFEELIFLPT